jgi:hypothetical protein
VTRARILLLLWTTALLLTGGSAFAQGKSQDDHGNANRGGQNQPAGNSGASGKGSNGKSAGVSSPSQVAFAAPAGVATATSAVAPFAWVDNATLIAPGSVWIGMSMARWQNAGRSEVSVPVVDAAIGMTPRLQIGASVPRTLAGDEISTQRGGLGTMFLHAKVALVDDSRRSLKFAVAPTMEILGRAAMQFAPIDQSRVQWGLPVSVELDRGVSRLYGSTGYFSPGMWYTGAGAGTQVGSRVGLAVSFSRAWSRSGLTEPVAAAATRHDISGSMSLDVTPNVAVFGSAGHTLKTAEQYGAGTTYSMGVALTARRSAFIH